MQNLASDTKKPQKSLGWLNYGYKKLFVTYIVAINHRIVSLRGYGSLGYGYQGIAQVMATTYDLDDFSKKKPGLLPPPWRGSPMSSQNARLLCAVMRVTSWGVKNACRIIGRNLNSSRKGPRRHNAAFALIFYESQPL